MTITDESSSGRSSAACRSVVKTSAAAATSGGDLHVQHRACRLFASLSRRSVPASCGRRSIVRRRARACSARGVSKAGGWEEEVKRRRRKEAGGREGGEEEGRREVVGMEGGSEQRNDINSVATNGAQAAHHQRTRITRAHSRSAHMQHHVVPDPHTHLAHFPVTAAPPQGITWVGRAPHLYLYHPLRRCYTPFPHILVVRAACHTRPHTTAPYSCPCAERSFHAICDRHVTLCCAH